jgi:hypothetical protein
MLMSFAAAYFLLTASWRTNPSPSTCARPETLRYANALFMVGGVTELHLTEIAGVADRRL